MKICSIAGCGGKSRARGWCNRHYLRWRAHGSPLGGNSRYATPEEALEARTEWQGDCLVWTGSVNSDGYPRFNLNGKTYAVHRYVWEQTSGTIPGNLEVDHICHNRACLNSKHMRLATREQNMQNQSGTRKDNTSGLRNISWNANTGKWQVKVKDIYLGVFAEIGEAKTARDKARKELFGEFAGNG